MRARAMRRLRLHINDSLNSDSRGDSLTVETWEQILLGVFALLFLFWFAPGIKPMLEKSKRAPKDWHGLLIPILAVVAFVIFLAMTL